MYITYSMATGVENLFLNHHSKNWRTCNRLGATTHHKKLEEVTELFYNRVIAQAICSDTLSPVVSSPKMKPKAPIIATRPTTVSTDGRLSVKEDFGFLGAGNSNQGSSSWRNCDACNARLIKAGRPCEVKAEASFVPIKATIEDRMMFDRQGIIIVNTINYSEILQGNVGIQLNFVRKMCDLQVTKQTNDW